MYCSSLSANACIHYIINRSVLSIYSMKRNFKKRWKLLKQLWQPFLNCHISTHAAAASFYILLSLLPSTALFLMILRYFPASLSYLQQVLELLLPEKFRPLIAYLFEAAAPKNSAAIISLWAILTLWTASKGIASIANGLSEILSIHEQKGFIRRRLEAMMNFLIFAIILAVTLSVQIFGEVLISILFPSVVLPKVMYHIGFLCSVVLLSLPFTLLYRILPAIRLPFRICFFSGLLSAISLSGSSFLFSVYVNYFQSYQSKYGGIGLLVLGILWIQLSVYILLGSVTAVCQMHNKTYRPVQIIKSAFGR